MQGKHNIQYNIIFEMMILLSDKIFLINFFSFKVSHVHSAVAARGNPTCPPVMLLEKFPILFATCSLIAFHNVLSS